MPRLGAVLFDLDGTLLDSAPDIRQAINLTLAEDGRRPLSLEEVKEFIGDGAMELCRKALLRTGGVLADDLYPYVQRFIGHYRSVRPDPAQVFEGARELLETLKAKDVKLGVCTNKADSSTHKILEQLDLVRYFGFIAGGDTFEVHKPHPGHVLGVLNALDVLPDEALFIGDGPNDVLACQRAGVKCVVITHGYSDDFGSLGADKLIPNFASFLSVAKEMGFEI